MTALLSVLFPFSSTVPARGVHVPAEVLFFGVGYRTVLLLALKNRLFVIKLFYRMLHVAFLKMLCRLPAEVRSLGVEYSTQEYVCS